jgi:hypothetical protein
MKASVVLVGYILAGLWVLLIAAQYPLSATLPMGNDTTRYIMRAQAVIEASGESLIPGFRLSLKNSQYPGAILVLALSKSLLPLSWPELFIWAMVIAQVGAGLALSWFVQRVWSAPVGILALLLWGLTSTVNHHFVNGIFAHLLSLVPMWLFFERLWVGDWKRGGWWMVVAYSFHALTGFFMAYVCLLVFVMSWWLREYLSLRQRENLRVFVYMLAMAVGMGIVVLIIRHQLWGGFMPTSAQVVIPDLIFGSFGPVMWLFPLGLLVLFEALHRRPLSVIIIVAIVASSALTAFNDWLGVAYLMRRFETYLVASACILTAVGLSWAIKTQLAGRRVLLMGFVLLLSLVAIKADKAVYAHFEAPNYARIHPKEIEGLEWMKTYLPWESVIVSTRTNLHSEWIPILTGRRWTGLEATDVLFLQKGEHQARLLDNSPYTHLVIFNYREQVGDVFSQSEEKYPVLFESEALTIVQLKSW